MKERIEALQARLKELVEKSKSGEFTAEDKAAADALTAEIGQLKTMVGAEQALDAMKGLIGDGAHPTPAASKSLMDRVYDIDAIKSGAGGVDVAAPGLARAVLGVKAQPLVTGATAGAGQELLVEQNLGLRVPTEPRLRVLDLITRGTSDADSIKWQELSFTNNAAVVTEATAATNAGATGGLKPDSAFGFVEKTATSQEIAHLAYVTRQMLRNRGYITGVIETKLLSGLQRKAEAIVFSDANYGLVNMSGVQVQTFDTSVQKTVLMARSKLLNHVEEYTPSAILMNPLDAVEEYAATDSGGWYYGGGPVEAPVMRRWGVPIVESSLVAQGTAWLGDFAKIHLDEVEAPNTAQTNSHLDFFARNVEAIRAEFAAILYCQEPAAVVKVELA